MSNQNLSGSRGSNNQVEVEEEDYMESNSVQGICGGNGFTANNQGNRVTFQDQNVDS